MSTKVAVLGMGYWGKNIVRNFNTLGALSTVCDSDPSVAEKIISDYPEVTFTTDYSQIIADTSISGVAIATPAVSHFEFARQALIAGKDVFVEKPLAVSVADGEELIRLANEHQRILMVGHILRYHPVIRKLKEMITKGELGELQYIYSNRLNLGKFRIEENILWSFAPHDILVILSLLDEEPNQVDCKGSAYLSKDIADVTMSTFRFPSGIRGHIFVSWLHPFKEQRLVVVGSEQMAVFDDTAEHKLVCYPHKVKWNDHIPTPVKADGAPIDVPSEEPLKNECQAFLDAIESRNAPVTDGNEGLRVLRILDACQKALENNGE